MTIEFSLILGLAAALAFLVWEYIRLHKLFEQTHNTRAQTNEAVHRKALAILDEARNEATKIIKEARVGAVAYRDKLTSKMEAALDGVANREINDFKNALEAETINIEKAVGQKLPLVTMKLEKKWKPTKQSRSPELIRKSTKPLLRSLRNC